MNTNNNFQNELSIRLKSINSDKEIKVNNNPNPNDPIDFSGLTKNFINDIDKDIEKLQ